MLTRCRWWYAYCPSAREEIYGAIKKTCCFEIDIPMFCIGNGLLWYSIPTLENCLLIYYLYVTLYNLQKHLHMESQHIWYVFHIYIPYASRIHWFWKEPSKAPSHKITTHLICFAHIYISYISGILWLWKKTQTKPVE